MTKFHGIAHLPGIIGAIDGTHVCLHGCCLKPDEHIFVNRKSRHSINVQLVCDAKFRITNVVARWGGSTHDSRILENSKLARKFAAGQYKGILLGDSGYPLFPWLMTPLSHPRTDQENAYNNAHAKTRSIIEQLNGQLKNKFRCLLGHGLPFIPVRSYVG
ncbi:putative nuclease HARBI1 [Strongylocentrotus purpuratus]|uniref:DDE Tnp4 domain-containing protein n=1 Tax=Strongylocentrotus purpuratus TaxID=7668 RepID=A0A7M7HPE5_STRPU|nr:putative nuclease HARBI1 [Strongylocentrotus purpuratus]|eukprot:XP_011674132.1 PREDICTED: putative nuclease HARBI1 [Strongylocentrotus purpuratus]